MKKNKILTNKEIEKIATDIRNFLDKHFLNGDCRIYFNNICWEHRTEDEQWSWDKEKKEYIDIPIRNGWTTIENINPKNYFKYANGIISMSFEGSFYDIMNGYYNRDFKLQDEFNELLENHGYYYELGNAWNLSLYEI